jgi:hypothetical protein
METGAIGTASPARHSVGLGKQETKWQKGLPMAGFCNLPCGLQAPNFAKCEANSRKVSGPNPEYYRFRETPDGDSVRCHCRPRGEWRSVSCTGKLSNATTFGRRQGR